MAIKKTKDETNLDNDTFLGRCIRCYRCGKPDRVIRQRPIPFTHTLAFAPIKGKPQGKGAGKSDKKTFFGETRVDDPPNEPMTAPAASLAETTAHHTESQDTSHTMVGENNQNTADEYWISEWFGDDVDAFMVNVIDEIKYNSLSPILEHRHYSRTRRARYSH